MVRRLVEAAGAPDVATGVVLAAAGSSNVSAQATVEAVAGRLAAQGWGAVVPAYASAAPPTPAAAVRRLHAEGFRRVVIATYLLAPGRFSEELEAAGADVVTAPLGDAAEVATLVLERSRPLVTPLSEA